MSEFQNKKIFIAGASKGIGFALAKELFAKGASLLLHASSDEGLSRIKTSFKSEKICFWQADFFKPEDFENSLLEILNTFGQLDGFVNCVGVRLRRPLNLLNIKLVQQTLTANFVSHIELIRIITKKSRFNKGLSILNLSSISAHSGSAAVSIYAASKAANESAIRCLAKELSKKQIRLNSVVCGQINTEAYQDLMKSKGIDEDVVLERQYLGLGEPIQVVNVVSFMLSEKSNFITGQSIPVDGGYLT